MASRVIPALFKHCGRAEFGGYPVDSGLDLVGLADVGADRERAPAVVLDLLHRCRAIGLAEVQDGHGHTVGGQPDSRPRANAAGCSGHDRDSP